MNDEDFIALFQLLLIALVLMAVLMGLMGCTVVVRHEYPPIILPPDTMMERMDYANTPRKGQEKQGSAAVLVLAKNAVSS